MAIHSTSRRPLTWLNRCCKWLDRCRMCTHGSHAKRGRRRHLHRQQQRLLHMHRSPGRCRSLPTRHRWVMTRSRPRRSCQHCLLLICQHPCRPHRTRHRSHCRSCRRSCRYHRWTIRPHAVRAKTSCIRQIIMQGTRSTAPILGLPRRLSRRTSYHRMRREALAHRS